MSHSTSSRSSRRRNTPFIPCIPCPNCGRIVKRLTSGTPDHNGWVFYKCEKHSKDCNFWHWELEYVIELLDREILAGDDAIEALGWAEDRRHELNLKKEELAATRPGVQEEQLSNVIDLLKQAVFLLQLVVGLGFVACVLTVLKK